MTIIQSIVLGIVEGITEFLPVSSTFHLINAANLLKIKQTDFVKLFEVFIQSGAILAVLFLYFKELKNNSSLIKKICVSFAPTAVIGFVLYKVIKQVFFESQYLMIAVFIFIAFLFLIIEILVKKGFIQIKHTLNNFSYKQALLIGLFQSIAIIPGVSRSGIVILVMMFLGFKRDESAKFSFMLAIPTIFAASIFDLYKMRYIALSNFENIGILLIGFLVSFIFAYISVRWFIKFLQTNTLVSFGIYRLIVAIILLGI